MGDIGTHAEIGRFVIGQVRKAVPDGTIPAADYAFLELGNFLTDVSQFRDPAAYHRAREQARSTAGFGGKIFGSADWVTEVFGRKSGPRHGALPEMLRLLMSATTHLVFDSDSLPRAGELVAAVTSSGPSILLEHGIPAEGVEQVLQGSYTQYFPHEHLDATPLPSGQVPSLQNQPDFARGQSTLLAYLERDLLFLSEQLSWLESSWRATQARVGISGMTDIKRQYSLANLGHILHAVEDYFFHSNLPEAHVWAAARAEKLRTAPGQEPSRSALLPAALSLTTLDPASTPLRRLLNRRLRFPAYQGSNELSTTGSEDATAFIYTGGFGQTDVWHTLGGALEALEDQLKLLPTKYAEYDPRNTTLVLFRMLLSQSARAEMVAKDTLEAQRDLHLKQLRSGEYHTKIQAIAKDYPVCEHTIKALLDAFDLDLRVSTEYDGKIATFPGPGAVLITMMHTMETEREASAAVKATLDTNPASADGLTTDNGCSAENIGTHTLMSKDATSKEPLRAQAVALAKHASASIALRFLSSVTQPAAANEGVDWDAELRFFVRGVTPGGWETELLTAVSQPHFQQPDVGDLRDQLHSVPLGPARDPARLAARRALTTTHQLEDYYRSLES